MNTVVKRIKGSFTVYSALFITLITTRIRGEHHSHCGPEELLKCAKPLTVLTDSGLTFVSTKADLDRVCPDLKGAIRCIHSYTRHCMDLKHRLHFKKLFRGTSVVVHDLCDNTTYQEEYLSYTPCMKEVAYEHELCFNRYSAAMKEVHAKAQEQTIQEEELVAYQKKKRETNDEGLKNVCCSFQEYMECSTHSMRRTCGEDAAQFSRGFLDKMASSMMKMHCSEFGMEICDFHYSSSTKLTLSKIISALIPLMTLIFLS